MSNARVPSSGLPGGDDDEGDGVAIGVNEFIVGSKWEPPGGLKFKHYASARVADKFASSEQPSSLPDFECPLRQISMIP